MFAYKDDKYTVSFRIKMGREMSFCHLNLHKLNCRLMHQEPFSVFYFNFAVPLNFITFLNFADDAANNDDNERDDAFFQWPKKIR